MSFNVTYDDLHTLVALSHLGERPEAILLELARRFDMSGLEEKASRTKAD